jgi:hypothetical protein
MGSSFAWLAELSGEQLTALSFLLTAKHVAKRNFSHFIFFKFASLEDSTASKAPEFDFNPDPDPAVQLTDFAVNHSLLWFFRTLYKKLRETRKLESIYEKHIVEQKNQGRKPDKNSSLRRIEFRPRNLD